MLIHFGHGSRWFASPGRRRSAQRAAVIYSLIGSAKLNDVDPRPAGTHCRAPPQPPRRAAALELAAQARSNRGLTVHINNIHSVQTIMLVARELGEDKDWLAGIAAGIAGIAAGMEPEDDKRHEHRTTLLAVSFQ